MDIAHQLGELLLEAVPAIIIVLLFYLFLRWAFFQPIQKAMTERAARIEGARTEAASVIEAARQETDKYHDALRRARAEVYAESDAVRQAALDNRAKLLKTMQARAQEEVAAAKKRIAAELASARADVESETPALASEIARSILGKPGLSPGGAAR
jgi:F0F1-type ATP synthase membrane subunit b/b'